MAYVGSHRQNKTFSLEKLASNAAVLVGIPLAAHEMDLSVNTSTALTVGAFVAKIAFGIHRELASTAQLQAAREEYAQPLQAVTQTTQAELLATS
jgi:hypothetical protein